IDGDGAIEDLSGIIDGEITAKAILLGNEKEFEYSFVSKEGFIYKKGWVDAGESIIIPQNPATNDKNTYFVGWDIDGDGAPDKLPQDNKISKNFTATAVFYTLDTYQTYWSVSMVGVNMLNATQTTGQHLKLQTLTWENSPSGSALVANWNGYGLNGENKKQLTSPYFTLPIPTDLKSTGFALWVDCGDNDGYAFTLYKQNKALNTGFIYTLDSNGNIQSLNASSTMVLPKEFSGWIVIPASAFGSASNLENGQFLQVLFDCNSAEKDTQKQIAFGSVVQFSANEQIVLDSLSKNFFSFKDYDGSMISFGVVNNTTPLTIPEEPYRERDEYRVYEFIGWDINGDNIVDSLPKYLTTSISATAVYEIKSVQFTYKFVDENGTVLLEKTADYNSLILPLFNYSFETDENHIVKVIYLDYQEGALLTNDQTFTVKIEEVKKTYSYKFIVDGWVYSYGIVEYDQTVPKPQDPYKEGYEFVGWYGYDESSTLFYDEEFKALFKEVEKPLDNSSSSISSDKNDKGCNLSLTTSIFPLSVILASLFVCKKRR
ncbi:MAG: InlB B-repeat-containing protein, partial [Clostridia bacterium]|nr:InlB B-repeat-containing protein [Clostridia bacterium]